MSTLNSTNMSVNRPTTKVRHAPGGASSISLSFDEQPVGAAKSGFKPTFDPSPELVEPVEVSRHCAFTGGRRRAPQHGPLGPLVIRPCFAGGTDRWLGS
jgi:hypothetical protein